MDETKREISQKVHGKKQYQAEKSKYLTLYRGKNWEMMKIKLHQKLFFVLKPKI